MTAAADEPPVLSHGTSELPEFELKYLLDDEAKPTEVTVFSPDEDITTQWLSVDFDHAIPVTAIR